MNRRSALYHEHLYRKPELMERIRTFAVTVCGAGALGGNIVESLARQGFGTLRVIDRDRIDERNLSTQPYFRSDVGAQKARILGNNLFRALGVQVESRAEELTTDNAGKLLSGTSLVIDTFDNSVGRQAVKDWCSSNNVPCLHAGLAADYAEVIWNEIYRVPGPTNDDVCDYPLARNLVMMTCAVACESTVAFVESGARNSFTITLKDFSVRPFGPV